MNKKNKDDVHKKNNSFRPTIEKSVFLSSTGLDFHGKTKFVSSATERRRRL